MKIGYEKTLTLISIIALGFGYLEIYIYGSDPNSLAVLPPFSLTAL